MDQKCQQSTLANNPGQLSYWTLHTQCLGPSIVVLLRPYGNVFIPFKPLVPLKLLKTFVSKEYTFFALFKTNIAFLRNLDIINLR